MVLPPLLDVALYRRIRAGISMFGGKPVTDALRSVALLARHALILLKPPINHGTQRLTER